MMGTTINPALLEDDLLPAVEAFGREGDFVGGEGNCFEDIGGEGDGFPIRDMYNVVTRMALRENGKYRNKRKIGCLDRIQTNDHSMVLKQGPSKGGRAECIVKLHPLYRWGGSVAAPQTGLTSCHIEGRGYPRTVHGNPRHTLPSQALQPEFTSDFLCADLHTLTRDPHIIIVTTPSSGRCTRTLLHI